MIDNDVRSSIRAKIRPFPRVATYAEAIEVRIDIEKVITEMAEVYGHSAVCVKSWNSSSRVEKQRRDFILPK